jgi:hypothetical protein
VTNLLTTAGSTAYIARPIQGFGERIFGDTNTDTIRSGNWYGNDTTWRMVIDLNRVLMYADKKGHIQDSPARRVFCIVDGIVGGEGNGPLDPNPKHAGLIFAGMNLVAVDMACARLMGFDYRWLPILSRALTNHHLPLSLFGYGDIICKSNVQQFDRPLYEFNGESLAFKPHFGWQGHVEI